MTLNCWEPPTSSRDASDGLRQTLATRLRVVRHRPVLDLVRDLRAVENRESNDAGSLLSVSDRHLADHDVFLGDDPVHIEAPAAGVRRIPRLNRCEVFSPDDPLARARPVDLAALREVTGRTVPVILLHGSPERLDSGATRHDREHRATTAPMWRAARLGQCSGMTPRLDVGPGPVRGRPARAMLGSFRARPANEASFGGENTVQVTGEAGNAPDDPCGRRGRDRSHRGDRRLGCAAILNHLARPDQAEGYRVPQPQPTHAETHRANWRARPAGLPGHCQRAGPGLRPDWVDVRPS